MGEVDELLELLAPLLGTNGSEPARHGDGTEPDAERGRPATTGEGVRNSERTQRARHAPAPASDVDEELMGAADAIADMAQRVQLNGPEPTYASEKLSHALYKAAEGLALCGAELHEVTEEARRGHGHGMWIKEDAR